MGDEGSLAQDIIFRTELKERSQQWEEMGLDILGIAEKLKSGSAQWRCETWREAGLVIVLWEGKTVPDEVSEAWLCTHGRRLGFYILNYF